MTTGDWLRAADSGELAAGGWLLASAGWRLMAVDGGQLALKVAGWVLAMAGWLLIAVSWPWKVAGLLGAGHGGEKYCTVPASWKKNLCCIA